MYPYSPSIYDGDWWWYFNKILSDPSLMTVYFLWISKNVKHCYHCYHVFLHLPHCLPFWYMVFLKQWMALQHFPAWISCGHRISKYGNSRCKNTAFYFRIIIYVIFLFINMSSHIHMYIYQPSHSHSYFCLYCYCHFCLPKHFYVIIILPFPARLHTNTYPICLSLSPQQVLPALSFLWQIGESLAYCYDFM